MSESYITNETADTLKAGAESVQKAYAEARRFTPLRSEIVARRTRPLMEPTKQHSPLIPLHRPKTKPEI